MNSAIKPAGQEDEAGDHVHDADQLVIGGGDELVEQIALWDPSRRCGATGPLVLHGVALRRSQILQPSRWDAPHKGDVSQRNLRRIVAPNPLRVPVLPCRISRHTRVRRALRARSRRLWARGCYRHAPCRSAPRFPVCLSVAAAPAQRVRRRGRPWTSTQRTSSVTTQHTKIALAGV